MTDRNIDMYPDGAPDAHVSAVSKGGPQGAEFELENGHWHATSAARDPSAFRAAARHSRRVRVLRKALPVAGILTAVAFVTFALLPSGTIGSFSLNSVTVSGKGLTMEQPRLSGHQRDARAYQLNAKRATQSFKNPEIINLDDIDASIEMKNDEWMHVDAKTGVYNSEEEKITLKKDVSVEITNGYRANLESADFDFDTGDLDSNEPVEIISDTSSIRADSVKMREKGKKVYFRGRVKMVLKPPKKGEKSKDAAEKPPGTQ